MDLTKEAAERARGWFKHHTAKMERLVVPGRPEDTRATRILWLVPGQGAYAVEYIIRGRYLIVLGDLGEAVYAWGTEVTFEWLADMNDVHYFHGKAQASRDGGRYQIWDERAAKAEIEHHFTESEEEREYAAALKEWEEERDAEKACAAEDDATWSEELHERLYPKPSRRGCANCFAELGGWSALGEPGNWADWLNTPSRRGPEPGEEYDPYAGQRTNGYVTLGSSYWDWAFGVGYVMDPQCIAHYTGLRMAVAQLRERGELPAKETP
jgi:hypothetical protein